MTLQAELFIFFLILTPESYFLKKLLDLILSISYIFNISFRKAIERERILG